MGKNVAVGPDVSFRLGVAVKWTVDRLARIEAGAVELLGAIGNPKPAVSALALADAFGLEVKRGFPGLPLAVAGALRSRLVAHRGLIDVAEHLAGRDLHEAVAHELGHWALREIGLPPSIVAADQMAAAFMMPIGHAGRDSEATPGALLARHAYCTGRLIEIRLAAYASLCPSASAGQAS